MGNLNLYCHEIYREWEELCLVLRKFEEKYEGKKIKRKNGKKKWKKIKNRFKVFNKLFLYTSPNLFNLIFFYFLKIKIIINFNFIWISYNKTKY